MKIYRIEHKETKLGPFQHSKQEVLYKGIGCSTKHFKDINHLPEIKRLLKRDKKKIKFGFAHWSDCRKSVINWNELRNHGFEINIYKVLPEFISSCGQVIYIDYLFIKNKFK